MTDLDNISGYKDVLTGERETSATTGAAPVPPVSAPELRSLLAIAVGTLVVAALYFGQDVLIPIVLAVMLSFVLSPVVAVLQRLRLWRAPAVIIAVLAALGMLGAVGTLIGSQAASLSANAPQYARTIEAKVQGVQSFAVGRLASITKSLGGHAPRTAAPATTVADPAAAATRPVAVRVVEERTSPLTIAMTVLAPVLGPLETTILVLIVAIFVLMQKEDLRDRMIRLFGSNDLHRTTRAMDDAGQRLSRYFLSQLAVNTCFGIIIGIGLWAIGVPSPAMWGVMAGLLRFVPYIGALIAAVAPAALAAAVDPGWTMAIEVVVLFAVVEPLTGYVVEPLLYGHSTGLSPVSVIVSAIFWTWLWGPIGLIMSTPLTLCLVVMGRHVKSLEFFDVLLGDRPALTPVETFYQRVLANNPDEALAQAEALLTDRSLLAYYDDVALAGLRLAVEDQARGTIDHRRQVEMTRTMQYVVAELGEDADIPRPVAGAGRVVCVAGSGSFDEAVTAMLAQLLSINGLATQTVANGQTSRDAIATLDLDDVTVIAISYLEVEGSPAQLRYLIKRLRAKAPGARVVVGLWPQGEAALSDAAIQRAIGADRYAGSLADAVEAISEEASAIRQAA
ncbi:AI-2E family transporter [Sphingomonas sp.]|uniref:AI-2E family transporter n=1 Tax=Sphingomonas sp. TaxID=28214 RepID=UPI003B008CBF